MRLTMNQLKRIIRETVIREATGLNFRAFAENACSHIMNMVKRSKAPDNDSFLDELQKHAGNTMQEDEDGRVWLLVGMR